LSDSRDSVEAAFVVCPIARVQALVRAVLRIALGGLILLPVGLLWPRLSFRPSGISNRMVDYSAAFLLAGFVIAALWAIFSGLRWLVLAVWPSTGIRFDAKGVELRLGPFGRRVWVWSELRVRYRHEMSIDLDDPETFEDIDADVETTTRLPLMDVSSSGERINELILRNAAWTESELADGAGELIRRFRTPPPV